MNTLITFWCMACFVLGGINNRSLYLDRLLSSDSNDLVSSFGTYFLFVFPVFSTSLDLNNLTLYALLSNQDDIENVVLITLITQVIGCTPPDHSLSVTLCPNCSEMVSLDEFDWTCLTIINTTVSVISTHPIGVVAGVFYENVGDTFTVLPINATGSIYRITTGYAAPQTQNAFVIIPLQSESVTTVSYRSCDISFSPMEQNLTFNDIFSYSCNADLTGMLITSSNPVAVLSGFYSNENAAFYSFEMLLPTENWGTRFLLSNIVYDADYNSTFKILASSNTSLYLNCVYTKDLVSGEHYIYQVIGISTIFLYSLQPISVFLIDVNVQIFNPEGNFSFFIQIPSLDHYLDGPMNFPLVNVVGLKNFAVINQNGPSLQINGSEITSNDSPDFYMSNEVSVRPENYFLYIQFTSFSDQTIVPGGSETSYSVIQYGTIDMVTVYGHVTGFEFNRSSCYLHSIDSICSVTSSISSSSHFTDTAATTDFTSTVNTSSTVAASSRDSTLMSATPDSTITFDYTSSILIHSTSVASDSTLSTFTSGTTIISTSDSSSTIITGSTVTTDTSVSTHSTVPSDSTIISHYTSAINTGSTLTASTSDSTYSTFSSDSTITSDSSSKINTGSTLNTATTSLTHSAVPSDSTTSSDASPSINTGSTVTSVARDSTLSTFSSGTTIISTSDSSSTIITGSTVTTDSSVFTHSTVSSDSTIISDYASSINTGSTLTASISDSTYSTFPSVSTITSDSSSKINTGSTLNTDTTSFTHSAVPSDSTTSYSASSSTNTGSTVTSVARGSTLSTFTSGTTIISTSDSSSTIITGSTVTTDTSVSTNSIFPSHSTITSDSSMTINTSSTFITAAGDSTLSIVSSYSTIFIDSVTSDSTSTLGTTTNEFSSTTLSIDNKITKIIDYISTFNITNNTQVTNALEILLKTILVARGNLNVYNIINATEILSKCSVVQNLDNKNFYLYIDNYNEILNQKVARLREAQFVANTTVRLLSSVRNLAINIESTSQFSNKENIALSVNTTDCSNISSADGGGLAIYQYKNNEVVIVEYTSVDPIDPSSTIFAKLPYSALCTNSSQNEHLIRNYFVIYRNNKLFSSGYENPTDIAYQKDIQERRGSFASGLDNGTEFKNPCHIQQKNQTNNVVTVSVLTDLTYSHLDHPIEYGFRVTDPSDSLHSKSLCASWNILWNSTGCEFQKETYGIYTCECSHMSDYSLLVLNSETDPSLCDNTLQILGLVVTSFSCFGLLATIILTTLRNVSVCFTMSFIDRIFERSRNMKSVIGDPLIVSLFFFYLLFGLLSDQSICGLSKYACEVSAAVMYTVLMSTLFFAGFAGLTFFKLYYIVFSHKYMNFFTSKVFIVAIGTGIPSLITIILYYTIENFFWRNDGFCWIRPTYVSFAVIIPTSIMVLGDIVLSGYLIKGFFFSGSKAIQSAKGRQKIIMKKVFILCTVQIVVGLPWVLQYFTVGFPYVVTLNYLFTLANATQGIWLTIIYMYSFYRSVRKREGSMQNTKSTVVTSTRTVGNKFTSKSQK